MMENGYEYIYITLKDKYVDVGYDSVYTVYLLYHVGIGRWGDRIPAMELLLVLKKTNTQIDVQRC
jgi:hypothetical protein